MGCLRLENLENPVLLRVLNGGSSDFAKRRERVYLYGYQGSEKDDEIKGNGNSYTTEFRQLDPRLGRWLSIDPVFQPWQSPYCSMDNNPIKLNDPLGNVTGDYFDAETHEYLGTDGVDDGMEYKIKKDDFNGIAKSNEFKSLNKEDKKNWLSSTAFSPAYHHEYSNYLGCKGSSKNYKEKNSPLTVGATSKSSNNNDGANNALSAIGSANDLIEGIAKLKGLEGIPGLGTALKVADYAVKIGTIADGDPNKVMNTAKEVTTDFVTGMIISKMLTSGHPVGIVAGVIATGVVALGPFETLTPTPDWVKDEWFNNRDVDNTNVKSLYGPGF
jgi:RHS repeat-associated protein